MNVDDKSEMTTSTSSFNERTQRMNSKVNDQFEKADDTDEDQDDFNFSADEELNVSLDERIEYVLSEETFSTTTEAKSFMKKKNYRYRGLRDGRKNGHKMLFTCSRFDKCPKKCYVLQNVTVIKKASKRQVPDEVEPDFDIFSEEARRKSARISAI